MNMTSLRKIGSPAVMILPALLAGCAMLPGGDRGATADELYQEASEAAHESDGYSGVGTAATREEARQNALEHLASQLISDVRSEIEQVERVQEQTDESRIDSVSETRATISSFTQMELQQVRTHSERAGSDGNWLVEVRLPQQQAQELIERAEAQAPLYAAVELLHETPETLPGERLQHALGGLYESERTGRGDDTFYHPETGRTTFASFFQGQVRANVARLQAYPLVDSDADQVRFILLDEESLRPQPGVTVRIGVTEHTTDSAGKTRNLDINDLESGDPLHMLGYPSDEEGNWLHPSMAELHADNLNTANWGDASETELLIYIDPEFQALAEIAGQTFTAPGRITVPNGRSHRLEVTGTDEFRGTEEVVNVPEGAPFAFWTDSLTQREYGYLDIRVLAGGGTISLHERRGGQVIAEEDRLERRQETGLYRIEISRDGDEDYQLVRDEVSLSADQTFQRSYHPPRSRNPYERGLRLGISGLRIGGEPTADYTLPWISGQSVQYGDLNDVENVSGTDYDATQIDLIGEAQYYFNTLNLTLLGAAGLRQHQFSLEQGGGDSVDMEIDSYYASLGAGFWASFFDRRVVSSLTINQGLEQTSWDSDSRHEVRMEEGGSWERLPSGSETNSYSFAQLNTFVRVPLLGDYSGLHVNAVVPMDTIDPYVAVGFSWNWLQRGYEHPREVSARQGLHY